MHQSRERRAARFGGSLLVYDHIGKEAKKSFHPMKAFHRYLSKNTRINTREHIFLSLSYKLPIFLYAVTQTSIEPAKLNRVLQ